jgi:hypothetical protein
MKIRPLFFLRGQLDSGNLEAVKTERPSNMLRAWARVICLELLAAAGVVWAVLGLLADPSTVRAAEVRVIQSTAGSRIGPLYEKPAVADVIANRARAFEFAEKTRLKIVPTMHLVETEHFLIFSAWNRFNDAGLSDVCERMYWRLTQQFELPAGESVWIGKLPIYIFWEPAHYARFTEEVDGSGKIDAVMAHVNGYHANRGPFAYVVINGLSAFATNQEQARSRFYHVLVHEGTHAFLHRYVSDRSMPLWIEEGLADFIAASLVPESEANRSYIRASKSALHDPAMLTQVLEKKKDLTPTEYGLAHSLVRLLVQQDRVAMTRFLRLMKIGRSESEALMNAYHMSNDDLIRTWKKTWSARNLK